MNLPETFEGFVVRRDASGKIQRQVESIHINDTPAGDVLIRVEWSSLNYKDFLASDGHPGVVRRFPHVPGIDAAGVVMSSKAPDFRPGQRVLVTGYELGAGRWGGWSQYIRVPSDWIVPLPAGLTARESMVLGTAGLTAAQCVGRIQQNGVQPKDGPVVVSGASGGVGCLAVRLLSHLGYEVTASTGKPQAADWLQDLGATTVVSRDDVITDPDRPLHSARWSAAVDTVGGATLASIIRSCQLNGCVTACGLVGGVELPLTVHPFILRGVMLAGVTSQNCPTTLRRDIWNRFANQWRFSDLKSLTHETDFSGLPTWLDQISRGQVQGRVVIRIGTDDPLSPTAADMPSN